MIKHEGLFQSFLLGGFECSTHRLRTGKRLDELAFTQHDRVVREDYHRLQAEGIHAVREGVRWHLIEKAPGRHDFSSAIEMVRAARETKTQVIWDLFHYGWPDWLDIFSPQFVDSLAALARGFGRLLANETDQVPFICPVNEISFFSWAAGESGYMNPFATGRGDELKENLVRANIAACEAIWEVNSGSRIAQIDPVINVLPQDPGNPEHCREAESYRLSQYAAWDMLAGLMKPELGGNEKYLDIIGGNYYVHNQWILGGLFIPPDSPRYRPFREIVNEVYFRYQRPFFVAETGIEDEQRPGWFRYICSEVRAALAEGAQVEGICLYPILNHPGWDDDRHCHNGLWDYLDENDQRQIYRPLADEVTRQRQEFDQFLGRPV